MKNTVYVEFQGNKIDTNVQMSKFKSLWREQGGKVKDLKNVNLYINADESLVYYVVNDDITGSFEVEK